MAIAIKSVPIKPTKSRVIADERKMVESPLSKMRGFLKGKIFYESDDIFYQYRFSQ
jgi:hypothetical protein